MEIKQSGSVAGRNARDPMALMKENAPKSKGDRFDSAIRDSVLLDHGLMVHGADTMSYFRS